MAKYRKKPVEIEAVQYTNYGDRVTGVCALPKCYCAPHVHTIHSNQAIHIEIGDWIIPEPDGVHFYPCKPDIFEQTYEAVE